jgi:hypothetical protein
LKPSHAQLPFADLVNDMQPGAWIREARRS